MRQLRHDLGRASTARTELLERINVHTLHAGSRECLDSAGQLAQELSRQLQIPLSRGSFRDKRDRWGGLAVHRRSYKRADGAKSDELELRVLTFPTRGFGQRPLGAAPREERYEHRLRRRRLGGRQHRRPSTTHVSS